MLGHMDFMIIDIYFDVIYLIPSHRTPLSRFLKLLSHELIHNVCGFLQ
jgi:hypothetical protein